MKTHFFYSMKYDLRGHKRSHKVVLKKFCDIFFVTFMLWRSFVIFFTLRPFELITTLTYVLMDNCCPCFLRDQEQVLKKSKSINSLRLGRYKD